MTAEKVGICLPRGLRKRARKVGLSLSHVCREAIMERVSILEKQTGSNAAKQSSPAASPDGEAP